MEESFENAVQELKRVDHLFWVSLKYTRTVDVIRNTVQRLINLFDYGLESILKSAKDKKEVTEVPKIPLIKAELIKKTFPDNRQLVYYADLYIKLRKIINSEYTKREEYRRHVTMTVMIEGKPFDVDIDLLKEYYDTSKEFISMIRSIIKGEEEL